MPLLRAKFVCAASKISAFKLNVTAELVFFWFLKILLLHVFCSNQNAVVNSIKVSKKK